MSQARSLPQKPHEEITYWQMVWTRFRKHHLATFGGGFLLFMIVLCFIGAPIYSAATGYGLSTQNLPNRYAFPTWQHWFGTDDLGRDVFLRIL